MQERIYHQGSMAKVLLWQVPTGRLGSGQGQAVHGLKKKD
jgi:hypothetical protein